jgi:hypothetical protein
VSDDTVGRVDRAIDRLDLALRAAGFATLAPAVDPAAVDEVDRQLGTYTLPAELRWFWVRVDYPSLRVLGAGMPQGHRPASALETYRLNLELRAIELYGPPVLFPIARDNTDQWSIELVSRWSPGGGVFRHELDRVSLEYPTFTDLLEAYAELIEDGRFRRHGDDGWLNHEAELERQEARLEAAGFGGRVSWDLAAWPRHWLESAGISPQDREPLGATHTIAELVEASAEGPLRGRIAGRVVRLAGSPDGTVVVVEDSTGSISVWCPAGVSPWGPRHLQRFEFEVSVEEPVGPPMDVDASFRELRTRDPDGPSDMFAAVEAMFARSDGDPGAVATAIRPLD